MCQRALTIKCNYYVKTAACDAFVELIEKLEINRELFEDHDLQLDETVDSLFKLFNRIDIRGKNKYNDLT